MKAYYFFSEHCPQCKVFKQRFVDECEKLKIDTEFVDAEKDENKTSMFGVRSIPTVVVVDDKDTLITSGTAATVITILNTL